MFFFFLFQKARAYAQQMTQSGDVSGAEHADRLAALSQSDLDYVRSCRRHGDSPPRFFYQNEYVMFFALYC